MLLIGTAGGTCTHTPWFGHRFLRPACLLFHATAVCLFRAWVRARRNWKRGCDSHALGRGYEPRLPLWLPAMRVVSGTPLRSRTGRAALRRRSGGPPRRVLVPPGGVEPP